MSRPSGSVSTSTHNHNSQPGNTPGCESVRPYESDSRAKGEQVREMFDNIAPAYDLMNRMMTFGIDRSWRRKTVELVYRSGAKEILDLATGTGDLAIQLARAVPDARITGADLSEEMLQVGRRKVNEAGLAQRVTLTQADGLHLPFGDATFDAVTVAFGVRNFEHLLEGYFEIARVLRPGGKMFILELSEPVSPLIRPFYRLYTRGVIPAVGRMVSHDARAYTYLPESIAAVPQGTRMTALISDAGLADAACTRFTFGVCSLYTAVKPS